jgi:hypothetical protein
MDIDVQGTLHGVLRLHAGPGSEASWRAYRWFGLEIGGDAFNPALAGMVIGLLEFSEQRALSRMAMEADAGPSGRLASAGCRIVEGDDSSWRRLASPDALDAARQRIGISGPLLPRTHQRRIAAGR